MIETKAKTTNNINQVIFGALCDVFGEFAQAGSGSIWPFSVYGTDESQNTFSCHILPHGGRGAMKNMDGLLPIAFPHNSVVTPIEIMELKANPNRPAEGIVVEAELDKGRGAVATVLVQRGTLSVGDIFVAGQQWGRVRALIDSHGNNVETAGPSVPVEVLGLNGAPDAGDEFNVVETEARAREIAEYRQRVEQDRRAVAGARGSLEEMFSKTPMLARVITRDEPP